jgi:hypothetical protein
LALILLSQTLKLVKWSDRFRSVQRSGDRVKSQYSLPLLWRKIRYLSAAARHIGVSQLDMTRLS